jgi:two-component system, sensor histidine kinase and response regulator
MDGRWRVLIVDDDPGSRDALSGILAMESIAAVAAEGGSAALAEMEREAPDLVLMDVMMPGMDGLELCRRIKAEKRWQAIPVILVTALDGRDDRLAGLEAGADEFVSKPVRGVELRARVRSMLRLKARHDELADTLRLRERMAEMFVRPMRRTAAVIREHGEALRSRIGRSEPFGDEEFRRIEAIGSEARHLEHSLAGLLLMARMDAGKLVLDRKSTNLNAILEKAQEKFSALAFHREVGLLRNLAEPAPAIFADAEMLRCALEILIAEALDASAPGDRVALRSVYPDGAARAEIRMDAPIPLGMRERLSKDLDVLAPGRSAADFAPAFSRMVLEAHGGRVRVESAPEGGAVAILELDAEPTTETGSGTIPGGTI